MSRRQALGIILACLLLLTGRGIRQVLLVGPEGRWRDQLWLDELVLPPEAEKPHRKEKRPTLTGPLPINLCSADSLSLLPGIGPVLADRIDEVRRRGVVFRSLEDLQAVKGIGPALSAKLESLVVFLIPEEQSEGSREGNQEAAAPPETPVPVP